MLKVLDLFSGIGGFSLGLERAGMETVAFCEIEPYAQQVLRKHWPEVPIYVDVREVTLERLRADRVPAIDVVTGGFPCQDLSCAGKKAGITGKRSGLWGELCRIIDEIRPQYAIMENVSNLLIGERGTWFGRVLGDLAEIGYDAEWHCIPASIIGAPHQRDRVWVVAYPGSKPLHSPILSTYRKEAIERENPAIRCEDWEFFALVPGVPTGFGRWREMGEPGLVRGDDGLPEILDQLKAYGNTVMPQIPEIIGRAILATISHEDPP